MSVCKMMCIRDRQARILRHCTAVTVNRHIFHDIDVNCIPLKVIDNGRCRIRHRLQERVVVCRPDIFRLSCTMNICLAGGRCNADRKLFERSAVSSHRMSLEMGKNQKRIIIRKVFSYKVLLNDFAVRDRNLQIRSLRIQKIDFKVPAPSMCLQRLFVLGCCITLAFVCSCLLYTSIAFMYMICCFGDGIKLF